MTATDFLSSLDFLTDVQRDVLRRADFDHADAIAERPPAYFEGEPYNLSPGRAGRLVAAARKVGVPPPTSTPTKIEVVTPDREKLIAEALRERPIRPQRLLDLGVTLVVERAAGEVDAEKTEHMRQFARGPVGATWHGGRVVRVDAIGAPTWINPRTGRSLQGDGEGGVDEVTLLPWGKLGEHGLRLTVFGEAQGFFRGMTDEAVLEAMSLDTKGQPTPLRNKVAVRAEALGAELRDVVVRAAPEREAPPAGPLRPIVVDSSPPSGPMSPEAIRALLDFLGGAYDSDGIRRLVAFQPIDGQRAAANLPGGSVPPAQLVFAAVDVMRRWGMINRALRDSIANDRPRRAAEVDRIFVALGVT